MIFFLPTASDKAETRIIETANKPVVRERDRLARAGLTSNYFEKVEINGWTLYITANVTKLPKNRERIVFEYNLLPFSIYSIIFTPFAFGTPICSRFLYYCNSNFPL